MIQSLLVAIVIFLIVVFLGGCQDVDPKEARYCEMVQRWKEQTDAGVPMNERAGWPPYRGDCN